MATKYGRLTIIETLADRRARVRCDCGNEKTVRVDYMKAGRTLSCGCLRAEMLSKRRTTHGMTESREYRAWRKMKERCYLPNTLNFNRWGGRGITVCEKWRNSFEAFLADMGPCPDRGTLDRINVDGNYEPGNCRWITHKEQMNNMSSNVIIEHDGKALTMAQWAEYLGIKYATLRRRIVIAGENPPHAFRPVGAR